MSKTVNFIEAINSGKRFRPVNWKESDKWITTDRGYLEHGDYTVCFFNARFEIEEKKIEITESELEEFFESIQSGMLYAHAKENLGFKDE